MDCRDVQLWRDDEDTTSTEALGFGVRWSLNFRATKVTKGQLELWWKKSWDEVKAQSRDENLKQRNWGEENTERNMCKGRKRCETGMKMWHCWERRKQLYTVCYGWDKGTLVIDKRHPGTK